MKNIKKMSKRSLIVRSFLVLLLLTLIAFSIAVSAKDFSVKDESENTTETTTALITKAETTTAAPVTVVTTTAPETTVAETTEPATQAPSTTKKPKAENVKKVTRRFDTISNFELPERYSIDENGVPVSYSKKLEGSATAYNGGYATSTGKTPQPGYIAVDPEIIPYGTEMWIVSNDGSYVYGYAMAADTGGFIYYGDTLADLYFDSYDECINFGRRDITIYIL